MSDDDVRHPPRPEKIWAAAGLTWVESDPEEARRSYETEYVRADVYRVALINIKMALDRAPDEFTSELWVSDDETLGAYVDKMLARIEAP